MEKMTTARALEILRGMDERSRESFSAKEREAIITLGAHWKMGTLNAEEKAEFEALSGSHKGKS